MAFPLKDISNYKVNTNSKDKKGPEKMNKLPSKGFFSTTLNPIFSTEFTNDSVYNANSQKENLIFTEKIDSETEENSINDNYEMNENINDNEFKNDFKHEKDCEATNEQESNIQNEIPTFDNTNYSLGNHFYNFKSKFNDFFSDKFYIQYFSKKVLAILLCAITIGLVLLINILNIFNNNIPNKFTNTSFNNPSTSDNNNNNNNNIKDTMFSFLSAYHLFSIVRFTFLLSAFVSGIIVSFATFVFSIICSYRIAKYIMLISLDIPFVSLWSFIVMMENFSTKCYNVFNKFKTESSNESITYEKSQTTSSVYPIDIQDQSKNLKKNNSDANTSLIENKEYLFPNIYTDVEPNNNVDESQLKLRQHETIYCSEDNDNSAFFQGGSNASLKRFVSADPGVSFWNDENTSLSHPFYSKISSTGLSECSELSEPDEEYSPLDRNKGKSTHIRRLMSESMLTHRSFSSLESSNALSYYNEGEENEFENRPLADRIDVDASYERNLLTTNNSYWNSIKGFPCVEDVIIEKDTSCNNSSTSQLESQTEMFNELSYSQDEFTTEKMKTNSNNTIQSQTNPNNLNSLIYTTDYNTNEHFNSKEVSSDKSSSSISQSGIPTDFFPSYNFDSNIFKSMLEKNLSEVPNDNYSREPLISPINDSLDRHAYVTNYNHTDFTSNTVIKSKINTTPHLDDDFNFNNVNSPLFGNLNVKEDLF